MRRVVPALLCVVGILALPIRADAQDPVLQVATTRGPRFFYAASPQATPVRVDVKRTPVLSRRITLDLRDVTLEEALNAITQQAGLKLGYSRAIVPLDKKVRIKAEGITVAGAIGELLFDVDVDVMFTASGQAMLLPRDSISLAPMQLGTVVGRVTDSVTGGPVVGASVTVDGTRLGANTNEAGQFRIANVGAGTVLLHVRRIGYARKSQSIAVAGDRETVVDFVLEKSASPLEQVVVTGTMVPTEMKAVPTAISVITAEDIEQRNLQRMDQVFRGQIPGSVAWDQGPGDFYSSLSVRGTSAFGLSGIKTYIDGVEVASIAYLAMIDPNSVERVEVIRGPEGSTLYGSEALNGVMQIFTKTGRAGAVRPQVSGKLSAGAINGYFGSSNAVQTDNSLSLAGVTEHASYSIAGSFKHLGEWTPNYGSRDWNVSAGSIISQGPFTLSGSVRYAAKTIDFPWYVQFKQYPAFTQPSYERDQVRQQTFGFTATYTATPTWTHTATLGYDATPYSYGQKQPSLKTAADTFVYAGSINWAKASLLYHTDKRIQLAPSVLATITGGVNYFNAPYMQIFTSGATRTSGALNGTTSITRTTAQGTGYFGQTQLGIAERLFVSAGLRADQNDNFGGSIGTAWSPRVGASYVAAIRGSQAKFRASYGTAIRAPGFGQRDALVSATSIRLANPDLKPERQHGVDAGIDLYVGGRSSIGVTYYNQEAADLIQQVTLAPTGGVVTRQFQNVGEVKNRGWEFEAQTNWRVVSLSGTYSITRSTIQTLPPGYTGVYQIGDQVTDVPRSTAGATLVYSPLSRTKLTGNLTHIGPWTDMDYIAYYGYLLGGQTFRGSTRAYWMDYPTVTKIAVGVSQQITKEVSAFVWGENVGNTLNYEQSNFNIPRPRSVVAGTTFKF